MSERKELVEKLRALACDTLERPNPYDTAADLIERDGVELERLRAEVERVTERLHRREADLLAQMNTNIEVGNLLDAARAALAETRRELLAARKVIASSRVVAQWAEPVTDSDWTEYDAAQRDLREYDAIMRDAPVEVPHGECPYPIRQDHSIAACVEAGDCGCGEQKP